jgi:hypothetical protein
VKRSALGTNQTLFSCNSGTETLILFNSSDKIDFNEFTSSYIGRLITTQVFRDTSSWYHFVFVWDSASATATNRMRMYVNGSEITTFDTDTNPSQNQDSTINTTASHRIANYQYSSLLFFSGYLANIHFIDGQALTPSSFTETDATTGQLIPKTYTGSYGTNGFNLLFADNSSNTASTLGKDTSGNSNNWTPNNLSVTAGAGNDSLVDSPTNYGTDTAVGGEVRGNYCTLNPLDKNANITPSNGNLDIVGTNTAHRPIRATIAFSSGKWYWEATVNSYSSGVFGIAKGDASLADGQFIGANASSWGYIGNGDKYTNGVNAAYGASFTTGDVIGVAMDADNGTLTFYKNGSSQGTAYTGLTSGPYFPAVSTYFSTDSYSFNFGQRAFAYQTPGTNRPAATFKALCTQNLPEGTITTSGTYTGNGVADGPFVYLNGVPTAMTVGGNAVTFGTHADKLSNGFKIRTTSTTYNQNALSYSYSITTTDAKFKYARAQPNP